MYNSELVTTICRLLDADILRDIELDYDESGYEYSYPVYAIGCEPDRAAGMFGGRFTEYHASIEDLERWLRSDTGRQRIFSQAWDIYQDDDLMGELKAAYTKELTNE